MEDLTRLADLLYEAALEPELWPTAIGELAASIGRSSVSVLSSYTAPTAAHLIASYRYDDQNWKRVQAEHSSPDTNRYIGLIANAGVGDVVWPRSLLSSKELHEDPIIRKFLRPEGLVDGLMVPLEKGRSSSFSALAIFSTQPYTPGDIQKFTALTTDLRRAFGLWKKLARDNLINNAVQDALDNVKSGVILLDQKARVIHANSQAREILADGDGITLGQFGAVQVEDRRAGTLLSQMTRAAIRSASRGHGRWSTSDGAEAISLACSVQRPSGSRPYTIVALPTRPPQTVGLPTGHPAAACVLFVTDPERQFVIGAAQLVATYGFTQREAEIVAGLVSGHSLQQTAKSLGMAVNSAKTLLQRAFDRCQVSRQSDLISLVLRGSLGIIQQDPRA